jgi:hypothetical protein
VGGAKRNGALLLAVALGPLRPTKLKEARPSGPGPKLLLPASNQVGSAAVKHDAQTACNWCV